MPKLKNYQELQEVIRARVGFVFNDRWDRRLLHKASCESLHAMTEQYDKYFFDDVDEATAWANEKYPGDWQACGRCLWNLARR